MLKQVLESLDGVEPAVASFYSQDEDGKYYLQLEGLREMKTALNKANKEAMDRRKRLEQFDGVDPDEFKALKEQAEKLAQTEAEKKGQYEALLNQHTSKFNSDREKWTQREKQLFSTIENNLVDAQAASALAAEKGVVELLLPHVKRFVRVVEEDGRFQAQVVDAQGNPRINDKHEPMTIHQLVQEMKSNTVYGRAFEGTGASGGGTAPNGPAGTARPSYVDPKLPATERLKLARMGGQARK